MKTRSALPTLALAALLVGLVPAPEARAEPEKPAAGDEAAPVASDYPNSKDELRAAVAELTSTLGPEREETLAARRVLADELFNMGYGIGIADKRREEEVERRAILALAVRLHGAGDPATFVDWEKLAISYFAQQKYETAEHEYRVLLAAMEEALRPEDEETLDTRQLLASCLAQAGKYAEAEQEYRALIVIRDRDLGVPSKRLLSVRDGLAEVLDKDGRHAAAKIEHRFILEALVKYGSAKDLPALERRTELAKCLLAQGKGAEALRELENIVALRGEVAPFGEGDGKVAEFLELIRKALAASEAEKPAVAPAPPASGEGTAE